MDYASMVQGTPGLVNYWRLGETSGTTAADSVASGGTNGTYAGTPTLGSSPAKATAMGSNGSVALNDGLTQWIDIGDVNDFAGTPAFTVELWFKQTRADTRILASKADAAGGWNLYLDYGRPKFQRYINGGYAGFVDAHLTPSIGTWHHIVAVSSTDGMAIYVDGKKDPGRAGQPVSNMPDTTAPLRIGAGYNAGTPNVSYDAMIGSIDEVAVYSRALTATEAQAHTASCTYDSVVTRTPGLHSYWRLDETSGPVATDTGPRTRNGLYRNSPSLGGKGALPSNGRSAPRFAVGAYQNVELGNTFDYSSGDGFTYELWMFGGAPIVDGRILLSAEIASPRTGFQSFVAPNTSTVYFDTWSSNRLASQAIPVYLASWNHFVYTFDGTSTARIYLNGTLVNTASTGSPVGSLSSAPMRLGANAYNGGSNISGALDEVATYNRALDPAEVASHYDAR